MARIFISQSGHDNDAAARMKTWLASQGFENVFLDKDPKSGVPPGADWEKTLYREVEQFQPRLSSKSRRCATAERTQGPPHN